MPTLHAQYGGEAQDQAGNKIPLAPQIALALRGPVIQVTLGIAESFAQKLIEQNKPVPEPISGSGLIDTGASVTCIDDDAAQKLGLPVIDRVIMGSASHDATEKNVYPVLIEFIGVGIRANVLRAVGATLANQDLLVLVGRDVLQRFTLFYNGPSARLQFPINTRLANRQPF